MAPEASALASATTLSATFPNASTHGNAIILAVAWHDAGFVIVQVTDTAHNTYTLADSVPGGRLGAPYLSQSIYLASNIAAVPSNKVSVTFNGAAARPTVLALEYSGISAVDQTGFQLGGSSVMANPSPAGSGPVTTTRALELLFAAGVCEASFVAADPVYQLRTTLGQGSIVQDLVSRTKGTYSATPQYDSGYQFIMQLISFR
jgi:hypothetical protein